MHVPERTPVSVAILNVILAAAADVIFGPGGLFTITGLGEEIKLTDAREFNTTAFSAGVLSEKDYNLTAITLTADTQFTITVKVDHPSSPEPLESQERSYTVSSGSTVPTANEIRDLFIARINQDNGRKVDATDGGAGIVTLTLRELNEGDFIVIATPTGTVEVVQTAFVEPAGTPAIVEAFVPGGSSVTATYKTYELVYRKYVRNNAISGAFTHQEERVLIFADTGAANFAAFDTEILAVMAGTHTPVADYLGV